MSALYEIFRDYPCICTDSRSIGRNSIFFALKGPSFDGNRFAADALGKGAAYAVIDDSSIIEQNPSLGDKLILTDNVLHALQELALEHRRELEIPILAITGSNGKTTTKELISKVMAEKFEIYATQGNLNNHIGVPLTLLAMTRDTEFGIVEMGASACGEIAELASIAEPTYGIITNIGRAHLEGFGGPEGVRQGKGELFDYLSDNGGRVFVPSEDEVLVSMAAERPCLAVEPYSVSIADDVPHYLEGEYNRRNIAAAIAVGRYFGVDDERMIHAVSCYHPDNNRSQRSRTDSNTLIIDCYNANPSSMEASVRNFIAAGMPDGCSGKTMILGDMLELGEWTRSEHRKIITIASEADGADIMLVGENFIRAFAGMRKPDNVNISTFKDREELMRQLHADRITDRMILIKGSRGMGLEKTTELL